MGANHASVALQYAADASHSVQRLNRLQALADARPLTRQGEAARNGLPLQRKRSATADEAQRYNRALIAGAVDQARERQDMSGAEILADIEKNNSEVRERGNKVFGMMYKQHAATRKGELDDRGGADAGMENLNKMSELGYFWAVTRFSDTITQVDIGREKKVSKWTDVQPAGPVSPIPDEKRKFVYYSNYIEVTDAGTKLVMNENFKDKDAAQEKRKANPPADPRPVLANSDVAWIVRFLAAPGASPVQGAAATPVAVDTVVRKNIKNVPSRDAMWLSDGDQNAEKEFRMGEDEDYRTLLGTPNVSGIGYAIAQRGLAGQLEYLMGIKRTPSHDLELRLERYTQPPVL